MKIHKIFHLIILYNILIGYTSLQAQDLFADRYNATYITIDEGLSNNFVDDIYKDSRGFLWIAMSGGGLSRYDGYEFINFNPTTPYCKLKSNFIRNVHEDSFQRLWVVSEGGTDIIDLTSMQSVLPDNPEGMLANLIRQPAAYVTQDALGCIWLYCEGQLHRISFDAKGNVENIYSLPVPNPYRNDIIFKDMENDGNIWIGFNGTLYKVGMNAQGELKETPIASCLSFAPDTYLQIL